jgi:integrase/recombinase XerD
MATIAGAEWNLATELVPNREEMARVLEMAKNWNARDYVIFALCSHTGLRISEAIHIKTTDLVNGKMRVTRRKKRVLQPSSVEISEPIWKLLTEWAQQFDGYIFPGGAKPCVIRRRSGKVEQVCGGGHLHIRTAQTNWRMNLAKTGLYVRGRGIHQTRHYFATEMYRATKDLRATQVALAHSSSVMTEKYAHVVQLSEQINKVVPVL